MEVQKIASFEGIRCKRFVDFWNTHKNFQRFRFLEMAALVEAAQVSEQGKLDYSCVITCNLSFVFDHF